MDGMRIDRISVQNFKKFDQQTFDFHPNFTLFAGNNGAGKSSILQAVSVALGAWTYVIEGVDKRDISEQDIRRVCFLTAGMNSFEPQFPVSVTAVGTFHESTIHAWRRTLNSPDGKTIISSLAGQSEYPQAEGICFQGVGASIRHKVQSGEDVQLPLIACYGAGRLWNDPTNQIEPDENERLKLSRFEAYQDCFNSRSSKAELNRWIFKQDIKSAKGGSESDGYSALKRAIIACVPESRDIVVDYDATQAAIVFADDSVTLFDDLSDGQRTMVTLVGDLARRAVILNPGLGDRVLEKTSGVVLIDEIDLHLHPIWQRRIVKDLKATFPGVQFICTSHSPQVIGEVSREEVRLLTAEGIKWPSVALGADSNWILDHVMEGATSETPKARLLQIEAEDALADGYLAVARERLQQLRLLLDGDTGELVRLESSLNSLEMLSEESSQGS